jgi:cohesin complex subunit SA-1/2
VTKQFLSHSSLNVLTHAMAAIRYFMDATSLSNTNSSKILELEDELSSALRDTVGGRDEIEVASFTEDEVLSLGAVCMRLAVLAGTRNMTAWIEEDEGGKQSSAWDIVCAIVERGRLGYKEEETVSWFLFSFFFCGQLAYAYVGLVWLDDRTGVACADTACHVERQGVGDE